MPPAKLPRDEAARLGALRSSGLLESGSDAELDSIVRQAADIFGTPIAAVSLLDGTHQRFKASQGIGVPYTSRDEAFCGYAILSDDVLVVMDAQADQRFSDNPLVLGQPEIRFYAGAPVFGPGHQPFGALCVIDTVTRARLDDASLASLQGLAARVSEIFSGAPRPAARQADDQAARQADDQAAKSGS